MFRLVKHGKVMGSMSLLRSTYFLLVRVPGVRKLLSPLKRIYKRRRILDSDALFEGRLIVLEALVQGLDHRIARLEEKN